MLNRIGVLASGGGSNLAALHEYLRGVREHRGASGELPTIVLVASDREGAGALRRASEWGTAAAVLRERGSDAEQLQALLGEHRVDLIVLAGYLRLVPRAVVAAYRGRMLNVHPALLPAFGGAGMYGERVHDAVLAAGARITGATVHFVEEDYDQGAIIAQWPVPVFPGDDAKTVATRVLSVEHLLLPRAVRAVARGAVRLDDHRTISRSRLASPRTHAGFTLHQEADDDIAEGIAALFPDE